MPVNPLNSSNSQQNRTDNSKIEHPKKSFVISKTQTIKAHIFGAIISIFNKDGLKDNILNKKRKYSQKNIEYILKEYSKMTSGSKQYTTASITLKLGGVYKSSNTQESLNYLSTIDKCLIKVVAIAAGIFTFGYKFRNVDELLTVSMSKRNIKKLVKNVPANSNMIGYLQKKIGTQVVNLTGLKKTELAEISRDNPLSQQAQFEGAIRKQTDFNDLNVINLDTTEISVIKTDESITNSMNSSNIDNNDSKQSKVNSMKSEATNTGEGSDFFIALINLIESDKNLKSELETLAKLRLSGNEYLINMIINISNYANIDEDQQKLIMKQFLHFNSFGEIGSEQFPILTEEIKEQPLRYITNLKVKNQAISKAEDVKEYNVFETVGDGSCGIHAIFGSANDNKVVCCDKKTISKIRNEFADHIKITADEGNLSEELKNCIKMRLNNYDSLPIGSSQYQDSEDRYEYSIEFKQRLDDLNMFKIRQRNKVNNEWKDDLSEIFNNKDIIQVYCDEIRKNSDFLDPLELQALAKFNGKTLLIFEMIDTDLTKPENIIYSGYDKAKDYDLNDENVVTIFQQYNHFMRMELVNI